LVTQDGLPLKDAIRRSERSERRRAFYLVAPLLFFLLVVFIIPILTMVWQSIYNPEIREYLPETTVALSEWDGEGVPPEEVFAGLVADMKVASKNRTLGRAATRRIYCL
jgi:putative spermidine/putrescine transport system permease protein